MLKIYSLLIYEIIIMTIVYINTKKIIILNHQEDRRMY